VDAILIAGGIPQPDEPLYSVTQGKHKALVDINGKAMVQWVLDALSEAQSVGNIVVIGLPPDSRLTSSKQLTFIPNQVDMLENIRTGIKKVLEINPSAEYALLVSSDIPTITAQIVDWVVNTALETSDDVYYNVISQEVMEKRFPASKRSYTKLRDITVCGGDINIVRTALVSEDNEIWPKIIAARKNVFKQASLLGFDTLLLLMLRAVTLEGAVKRVSKRLNLRGRAVLCPFAEVGMDVDKPFQLEIVQADLSGRGKA